MQIDSTVLKALPSEQQDRFVCYATEIVCESFVFTGDRDYITARFAFFQKQSHLFMWSAAQALEKYLKANILLLGTGVIGKTHSHIKLANALKETHPQRLTFDASIPSGWEAEGVMIWPELDLNGFMQRVETIGSPNVRYDQVKLDIYLQDLVFLDRMAFALRHRLVEEAVESCRLVGDVMKLDFFQLNYPFAPVNFQHRSLRGVLQAKSTVSTLEAAVNGCFGSAKLYQDWATKNMGLNERAIQSLMKGEVPI